jgi:hypothetical protein
MVYGRGTRAVGDVQGELGQGEREDGLTVVCPVTGEAVLTATRALRPTSGLPLNNGICSSVQMNGISCQDDREEKSFV